MACRVTAFRRLFFSAARPVGARPAVLPRWKSSSPVWSSAWRPSASLSSANLQGVSRLRPQQECWNKRELLVCRTFAGDAGMTLSELQEQVINVLKMFDKINPDNVTLDAHFVNDLGLDSLDVVEIVMAFEDEFAVEINDEQAEKIFTAADAVEYLKTQLDIH